MTRPYNKRAVPITARYPGTCTICGQPWTAGQKIRNVGRFNAPQWGHAVDGECGARDGVAA